MKLELWILSFVSIAGSFSTPVAENAISSAEDVRIIGGHETERNAYPFMARVSTKWKYSGVGLCGGSLIHARYVITAAHCVWDPEKNNIYASVSVFLGDYDKTKPDPDELEIEVEEVIIHEGYSKLKKNDIALLKLSSEVTPDGAIRPICLTSPGKEYVGMKARSLGWGLTSIDGIFPNAILKEVTLPIVKDYSCNSVSLFDPSVMMCTGVSNGKDTVFRGDSGGPLFITENDRTTLVGVGSYVRIGGLQPKVTAGVFVKLSALTSWIQEKIQLDICMH